MASRYKTPLSDQWVKIDIQGRTMEAYLTMPEGEGHWPAVIVLMEIFGVNSHIQDVTRRIAAEGYVAIAPNYYHRTTANLELDYTDRDVAIGRQHKERVTREGLLVDLRATIQFLQDCEAVEPKQQMGCIGFCFGGHAAFIAAGMKEIVTTASFYGAGIANTSPGGGEPTLTHVPEIQGELLCLFGEDDPLVSHEDTATIEKTLKKYGTRHNIIRYNNTGHGFFCDQRDDFDPSAAEDAWYRIKNMFSKLLQAQPVQ